MTPKSLLRHKRCVSDLAELAQTSSFHRVLYETAPSPADQQVERVILCSGKVYYDLWDQREKLGVTDKVALIRLEELAPFPETVLSAELGRYGAKARFIWAQEEPRNMGAWFFVAPRIENSDGGAGQGAAAAGLCRPASLGFDRDRQPCRARARAARADRGGLHALVTSKVRLGSRTPEACVVRRL